MNLSTTERNLLLSIGVTVPAPEPDVAPEGPAQAPGFFERLGTWIQRERAATAATERDRRMAATYHGSSRINL